METYIRVVVRNRFVVIALCVLITALSLNQMRNATFGSSLGQMFLGENPEYQAYLERLSDFATDEIIVLALENVDITSPDTLDRLDEAVDKIEEIEEVDRVLSVSNSQQIMGGPGLLRVRKFGDLIRSEPENTSEIFKNLAEDPLTGALLLGGEGKHTALVVELISDPDRAGETAPALVAEIQDAMVSSGFDGDKVHKVGILSVMASVIQESIWSVVHLLPLVLLALVFTVYLMFRRIWPVFVGGGVAIIAVIWTMGFSVFLEPQISIAMALAPSVILIVSMSDVIHLCSAYLLELKDGKGKDEAILASGTDVGTACLYTSFTTFFGFAAISFVPAPVFRLLGIVLGFGVGTALLLAMTLTPIFFSFMDKPPLVIKDERSLIQRGIGNTLDVLSRISTERSRSVIVGFVAVSLLVIYGLSELNFETRLIERLAPDHPARVDNDFFRENFRSAQLLDLYVSSKDKEGLLDPVLFAKLKKLQESIDARDDVEGVYSVVDLIHKVHHTLQNPEPEDALPKTRQALAQYILLFEMAGGKDFDRLVDFDRQTARFSIQLKDEGFISNYESGLEISKLARSVLGPDEKVVPSGAFYLLGGWIGSILDGQRLGLIFTFFMTSVMMCIGLRSLRVGLWSMIPNAFPLFVLGGCLGLTMDAVDSDLLVLGMLAIGIGVDDTIHFMMRYRIEALRCESRSLALRRTYDFAGRGIVMTTICLAIGFLPFAASSYMITRMHGILLPLTFIVALAADLLLVPALAQVGFLSIDRRER